MTEGHDRRHNVTARDVENVAHAGLVARRDGPHVAPQPTGSCRQQYVPDERIDGRPAGDLVPIQVAIGGGECREVRAYDEHDWYLVEPRRAGKGTTPRTPARARVPLLPSGPGGVDGVAPCEGSAVSLAADRTRPCPDPAPPATQLPGSAGKLTGGGFA